MRAGSRGVGSAFRSSGDAFARHQFDILGRDVILEINKGLYPALVLRRWQHIDNRARAEIPIARTCAHTLNIFIGHIWDIGAKIIAPFQAAFAVRP